MPAPASQPYMVKRRLGRMEDEEEDRPVGQVKKKKKNAATTTTEDTHALQMMERELQPRTEVL